MACTAIYSYIRILKKHGRTDDVKSIIDESFNTPILKVINIEDDLSSILLKFSKTKIRINKNTNLRDKLQTEVHLALDVFIKNIMNDSLFNECSEVTACIDFSNIIINKCTNTILVKFKSQ